MNVYVKTIKFSNFLSFFGEQEVNLEPYTAIICNFEEGKKHFFKAIEFVFGATLDYFDIQKKTDLDNLINPAFLRSLENPSDKKCYVEVILQFVQKQKELKMKRTLEKGRIRYYINDRWVTETEYNKELNSLNLHIVNKNLIFHEEYFVNAIWGSHDDLEDVVTEILREPFILEEWKKSKDKIEHLQKIEKVLANRNKHYSQACKVIDKFLETYGFVTYGKECSRDKLLREICRVPSEPSSPISLTPEPSSPMSLTSEPDEFLDLPLKTEREFLNISKLVDENQTIQEEFQNTLEEEAILIPKLLHDEVQLLKDPENRHILVDRIKHLKALERLEEDDLLTYWNKFKDIESEQKLISKNIGYEKVLIEDILNSKSLRVRLTSCGRFADHISFSPYYDLLKNILGNKIFYGNLLDTHEEALRYLNYIKKNHYECQETFIILENYKAELKDLILFSDENGIKFEGLEQLQIFLLKLKHYELIDSVTTLVKQEFNYRLDRNERDYDVVFLPNNIFINSDNVITQKCKDEGIIEDEEEIVNRLNELSVAQEMKYHEVKVLYSQRLDTLSNLNNLEHEIYQNKIILRESARIVHPIDKPTTYYSRQPGDETTSAPSQPGDKRTTVPTQLGEETSEITQPDDEHPSEPIESATETDIYAEYADIFQEWEELLKEVDRMWEDIKNQIQQEIEEEMKAKEGDSDPPIPPPSVTEVEKRFEQLDRLKSNLKELKITLMSNEKEIEGKFASFPKLKRMPRRAWIATKDFMDKSAIFFDKEFAKLQESVTNHDIDFYLGSEEWRKSVLESFAETLEEVRAEIKRSKKTHADLNKTRKNKLTPFTEHCSQYFFYTYQHMLGRTVPFLDLYFDHNKDTLEILTSLRADTVNIVDFGNLNVFHKFITVLSLFLQAATFEKMPLMVLDDVEKFYPPSNDALEDVLDPNISQQIMPYLYENNTDTHIGGYYLKMRIGEYLEYFIRRNTPRPPLRRIKTTPEHVSGPLQIIYFSSGDLSLAAKHQVFIHQLSANPIKQFLATLFPISFSNLGINFYLLFHSIYLIIILLRRWSITLTFAHILSNNISYNLTRIS